MTNAQRRYYEKNKELVKARSAQWQKDHPERARENARRSKRGRAASIKEYSRHYYVNNRERILRRTEAYRKAHASEHNERARRWQRSHPEYVRAKAANRKCLLRSGLRGSGLTHDQWVEILGKYNFRCAYCGACQTTRASTGSM